MAVAEGGATSIVLVESGLADLPQKSSQVDVSRLWTDERGSLVNWPSMREVELS